MTIKQSTTYLRFKDEGKDLTTFSAERSRVLASFRDGVELPDYRQRIVNHGNATTALSAYRDTVVKQQPLRATGTYAEVGRAPIDAYLRGQFTGDLSTLQIEMTAAERDALGKQAQALARSYAFKRIQKYQDPFNTARETLGELKETIELLRNPLQTMTELTKSFAGLVEKNHRRGSKSDRASKAAADAWLEYNFAIAPLVKSIAEIRDQILYDRLNDFHTKQRVFVGDEAVQTTTTSVTGSLNVGSKWHVTKEVTVKKSAECYIHFGMLIEKLLTHEHILNNMDETLLNVQTFPALAWELTPLSVFVDYIVNVGDIISGAMTSQSAVSYSSETVVHNTETTIKVWNPHSPYPNGYKTVNINTSQTGILTLKRRRIQRVGGSIGIPPMIFTLPGSNIKYMNIAALVASINARPHESVHFKAPKGLRSKYYR